MRLYVALEEGEEDGVALSIASEDQIDALTKLSDLATAWGWDALSVCVLDPQNPDWPGMSKLYTFAKE